MTSARWTWGVPLSTGIIALAILGLAPLFGWALATKSWLILSALALLVGVPVIVRWPVVSAFGLYAFLVPFDSVSALSAEGVGGSLTKLVGLLAGGVLLVAGLTERRLHRPPLAALLWGLLVLWAALSAMWAINPAYVRGQLPTVLSLFVLYVIAVCIKPSRQELYWVCLLLVIGGSLAAAIAYFYGLDEPVRGTVRGRLVIGDRESNPNLLGAALIPPFALAIAGFIRLRGAVQRAMAGGSIALIGLGIYISSRAAVVGLVVAIAVLFYRLRVRGQLIIAVLMLVVLVATLPDALSVRITRVLSGEDTTGSGRIAIWQVGLDAVKEFGIFGAGLANFVEAYNLYAPPMPLGTGRAAHNSYLMVWVDLGIVGLALMFAALGSQFLGVHNARKAGGGGIILAALEAAWFGELALMFFTHGIYTSKMVWLSWILLAWAGYCREDFETDRMQEGGFR
jgi:hypothetical protein